MVMDIVFSLVKKMLKEDISILGSRKIMQSAMWFMVGIILLNNAFILFALAVYNYLLFLLFSPVLSALLGGMFFLLFAGVFFGIACKIISRRKHFQTNVFVKDALNAFVVGFKDGR